MFPTYACFLKTVSTSCKAEARTSSRKRVVKADRNMSLEMIRFVFASAAKAARAQSWGLIPRDLRSMPLTSARVGGSVISGT
jgi:hypothetical protein